MAYRQTCEKEKEENERRRKEKEKEEAEIARRQKELDALKAKNASLLEKETALKKREKELGEKLEGVGQLLIDGNSKVKSSVKSSNRDGISAADEKIEAASGLSQKLNDEMSEIREKQRNVECQKRKLIEKSLGEVPAPTKKARVCATVSEQASKKKSKKKFNVNHSDLRAVVKASFIEEFPNAVPYLKIHELTQNSDSACVSLFRLIFGNSKCFCSKSISLLVTCIHRSVNAEFWTRTS